MLLRAELSYEKKDILSKLRFYLYHFAKIVRKAD